jgi:hypothetical protein
MHAILLALILTLSGMTNASAADTCSNTKEICEFSCSNQMGLANPQAMQRPVCLLPQDGRLQKHETSTSPSLRRNNFQCLCVGTCPQLPRTGQMVLLLNLDDNANGSMDVPPRPVSI